jgi:hypothetical protein
MSHKLTAVLSKFSLLWRCNYVGDNDPTISVLPLNLQGKQWDAGLSVTVVTY